MQPLLAPSQLHLSYFCLTSLLQHSLFHNIHLHDSAKFQNALREILSLAREYIIFRYERILWRCSTLFIVHVFLFDGRWPYPKSNTKLEGVWTSSRTTGNDWQIGLQGKGDAKRDLLRKFKKNKKTFPVNFACFVGIK